MKERPQRSRAQQKVNPISTYPEYMASSLEKLTQQLKKSKEGLDLTPIDTSNLSHQVFNEIIQNHSSIVPDKFRFSNPKSKGGDTTYYDSKEDCMLGVSQLDPGTLAHELMHREDHKKTNLYHDIWGNIRDYQQKHKIPTWSSLEEELVPIKAKIAPMAFKTNKTAPYHVDSNYLKNDLQAILNKEIDINNDINEADWENINQALNRRKKQMPLVYGSEFPSFMMENITRRWHPNESEKNPSIIT